MAPAVRRLDASLSRLLQRWEIRDAHPLVEALTDRFFGDLQRQRMEYLAVPGRADAEELRRWVAEQHVYELRAALEREVAELWPGREPAAGAFAALGALLPAPLQGDEFASPARFRQFAASLRTGPSWRGAVRRSPIPPSRVPRFAAAILRAVQAAALRIVDRDYASLGEDETVPETVGRSIDRLLRLVEEHAERVGAEPFPLPLAVAVSRLRCSIARAERRVCLPLRNIPTAPLTGVELADHYVGRPDEAASRLARQIRHADGAILVSGYRGVGKSSYVNRVLHHATLQPISRGTDDAVVVPVPINLAKASGVQNVLRLTLRALRNTLLDEVTGVPRPIPGQPSGRRLPLFDAEIASLQWAYTRATFRVAISRAHVEESKRELGSAIGFGPTRPLAALTGLDLKKLVSAGYKASRAEKFNRELSLLDFDENAAEEALVQLIQDLSRPRPLAPGAPEVRLKLVFVFDELDKMDVEAGVRPLIEGLKNLFLQPNAVFFLVTSKRLYYDLLKDRAVEDAILNSYFSAIVHVPLLTFPEVRRMLEDWVDRGAMGAGAVTLLERESALLDRLARYLTYHTTGNPRELIRQLRQMQEWGMTGERPFLTDAIARSREIDVFAAVQQAVERVTLPRAEVTAGEPSAPAAGGLALASERLSGDEARLEQIRRGMYILVEELLNRQTLCLEADSLEEIRTNNFSLISPADLQLLAERLATELATLHPHLELTGGFQRPDGDDGAPLFEVKSVDDQRTLWATPEFYSLTGRHAAEPLRLPTEPADRTEALIARAVGFAKQSRAEQWSALGIMRQLDPARWTDALDAFLLELVRPGVKPTVPAVHRQAAAELLKRKPAIVHADPELDLGRWLADETDAQVRSALIAAAAAASNAGEKTRAAAALLGLLKRDADAGAPLGFRRLTLDDTAHVEALTALAQVAETDGDVAAVLLDWIWKRNPAPEVFALAGRVLVGDGRGERLQQLAELVIESRDRLEYFAAGRRESTVSRLLMAYASAPDRQVELVVGAGRGVAQPAPLQAEYAPVLWTQTPGAGTLHPAQQFIRELVRPAPLHFARRLIDTGPPDTVADVVAYLWETAFRVDDDGWLRLLAEQPTRKVAPALRRVEDFGTRYRPLLERRAHRLDPPLEPGEMETLRATLNAASAQDPLGRSRLDALASGAWDAAPPAFPSFGRPGAPSRDPTPWEARHLAAFLAGLALIVAGFTAFTGDLPEAVTTAQRLGSRGLSLVAAGLMLVPFYWARQALNESGSLAGHWRGEPARLGAFAGQETTADLIRRYVVGVPPLLGLGLLTEHSRLLGWALTPLNQLGLLVLNAVGLLLLGYALSSAGRAAQRDVRVS